MPFIHLISTNRCAWHTQILHYLETLRPHQLLEQMVCTAFRASADTLNESSFGALKQMNTKVDQLYITMASTLAPLQGIAPRPWKFQIHLLNSPFLEEVP